LPSAPWLPRIGGKPTQFHCAGWACICHPYDRTITPGTGPRSHCGQGAWRPTGKLRGACLSRRSREWIFNVSHWPHCYAAQWLNARFRPASFPPGTQGSPHAYSTRHPCEFKPITNSLQPNSLTPAPHLIFAHSCPKQLSRVASWTRQNIRSMPLAESETFRSRPKSRTPMHFEGSGVWQATLRRFGQDRNIFGNLVLDDTTPYSRQTT
jgi:hypothetical protein